MIDILYYDKVCDLSGIEFTHPMRRRMTEIQQLTCDLLFKFKMNNPELWELANSYSSHIYHANSYGEIDLSLELSRAVKDKNFPLSPKSFQNSLYNIAMGYASIVTDLKAGYTCISDSQLALDKSLYFASQMIKAGVYDSVLILNTMGSRCMTNHSEFRGELLYVARSGIVSSRPVGVNFSSDLCFKEVQNDGSWLGDLSKCAKNGFNKRTQEGIVTTWNV